MREMILFAFPAYEAMAAAVRKAADLRPAEFGVARFENGELHIDIRTPVRGRDCFILGSVAPPDEQMFSVLLLSHTLKKEGARDVTAILPYLAYSRHDKDKPGESLATAWFGAVGKASGMDRVITVDVHSERGKKLFPIPVISLSPAEIFAEALNRFGLLQATIVAPDEGAIRRCEAVKKAAGISNGRTPYFEKQRTTRGVLHGGLVGDVGDQVVIIDDILDTGGTLVSACQKLSQTGVKEINIMVTHGLFTGGRWKELWPLSVKRIFCTNSVPITPSVDGAKIEWLSVVPLLERELCATPEHRERSTEGDLEGYRL
jgi:ribose-phosphate pyrophosphokinase